MPKVDIYNDSGVKVVPSNADGAEAINYFAWCVNEAINFAGDEKAKLAHFYALIKKSVKASKIITTDTVKKLEEALNQGYRLEHVLLSKIFLPEYNFAGKKHTIEKLDAETRAKVDYKPEARRPSAAAAPVVRRQSTTKAATQTMSDGDFKTLEARVKSGRGDLKPSEMRLYLQEQDTRRGTGSAAPSAASQGQAKATPKAVTPLATKSVDAARGKLSADKEVQDFLSGYKDPAMREAAFSFIAAALLDTTKDKTKILLTAKMRYPKDQTGGSEPEAPPPTRRPTLPTGLAASIQGGGKKAGKKA